MTNFGGVDVVPLLGAIAGCHCRVPLRVPEGKVTTNFGGVQGARGEGDDQLWGSGRGAI